jgi:hypothetical protein
MLPLIFLLREPELYQLVMKPSSPRSQEFLAIFR